MEARDLDAEIAEAQNKVVELQFLKQMSEPVRSAHVPHTIFTRDHEVDPNDLHDWWYHTSKEDYAKTVPKTEEYGGVNDGSSDLRTMGYALAELCGMHDAPEPVKLELACWFYALGKVSRLISDYKQGKPGKPDTWFDLSVYAMMARRIQQTGSWP